MSAWLTVAIPTYNRNAKLAANLPALLAQLDDGVEVVVIDNCSPTPVTVPAGETRVRLERNAFNIGGNGNIVRCLERCRTPWVWILADDDPVEPDAIATVRALTTKHPDAVFINCSTRGGFTREREIVTRGRSEFIDRFGYAGNVIFISSCVYRAEPLRQHLSFAFHYGYSCAPHLAMTLLALGDAGVAVLSDRIIATWDRPLIDDRGSVLTIALGLATLIELPLGERDRRALARRLANFPPVAEIAHQCLLSVVYGGRRAGECRRAFGQIIGRLPATWTPLRHLRALPWRLLLWWPRLSLALVAPLYRLVTRQPTGANKLRSDRL